MSFLSDIGHTIFGGSSSNQNSSSTSSSNSNQASGNLAFPFLAATQAGPSMYTQAGGNLLGALLGVPGYANATTPQPPSSVPGPTVPPITTTPPPLPAPRQFVDLFHDGIRGNGRAAQQAGRPTSYWQDVGGGAPAAGQMARPGLFKQPGGVPPVQNPITPPASTTPAPTPAPSTPATPGPTGADGATSALNAFANSAGLKFLQDQGNQMINNNAAAKGMLQSGSTLKGLQEYANNLNSTYLNDYISKLLDFSKLGLGSAGVLAGAGNYSSGNSLSSGTSSGSGSSFSKPGILHDLMSNPGFGSAVAGG